MDTKYYRVDESYYTVVGIRNINGSEGLIVALRTADDSFSLEFSKKLFGCIDDNKPLIEAFLKEKAHLNQETEVHLKDFPYEDLSSEEKYWFKVAFERYEGNLKKYENNQYPKML